MKTYLRIIGDLHGAIDWTREGQSYFDHIKESEYTVQIGDLGFEHPQIPDFHKKIDSVDKTKHVAILGNHDDYNHRISNALGDFGTHSIPLENGKFEFFYIRGAYSPDKDFRTPGYTWWAEEQLSTAQGFEAVILST